MGVKHISFVDCNDNVILKDRLTSLPLKERNVIDKSISLFNDREPCIIHRTFVMKKIYLEIDEYFNNILSEGKNEILVEFVPDNIIQVLDLKKEIQKILID